MWRLKRSSVTHQPWVALRQTAREPPRKPPGWLSEMHRSTLAQSRSLRTFSAFLNYTERVTKDCARSGASLKARYLHFDRLPTPSSPCAKPHGLLTCLNQSLGWTSPSRSAKAPWTVSANSWVGTRSEVEALGPRSPWTFPRSPPGPEPQG